MKKTTLYSTLLLTAGLLLWNCSEMEDPGLPVQTKAATEQPSSTRSLEGAVFHEVTGVWMVLQNDPYTLDEKPPAHMVGKCWTVFKISALLFISTKCPIPKYL